MIIQKTFKNNKATIFMVGTPIGNLDDFNIRSIEILKEVDLICCEDTRTSAVLLKKYNIKNNLLSLHKFNENERINQIKEYLDSGKKIAIISDAGVPIISDPGALIVNKLFYLNVDFNVSSINCGPAYVHAIVSSRFNAKRNFFYGFIQNKNNESKKDEMNGILGLLPEETILSFYESVHRIKDTLMVLSNILDPKQKICISRELTKINEEIIILEAGEITEFLENDHLIEKGEFVIVIDKIVQTSKQNTNIDELVYEVQKLIDEGLKLKLACEIISNKTQISKNELYNAFLSFKKSNTF